MDMNIEVAGTHSTLFVSEHKTEISSNRDSPWTSATLAWLHTLDIGGALDLIRSK
jgi:hypothetical protein